MKRGGGGKGWSRGIGGGCGVEHLEVGIFLGVWMHFFKYERNWVLLRFGAIRRCTNHIIDNYR